MEDEDSKEQQATEESGDGGESLVSCHKNSVRKQQMNIIKNLSIVLGIIVFIIICIFNFNISIKNKFYDYFIFKPLIATVVMAIFTALFEYNVFKLYGSKSDFNIDIINNKLVIIPNLFLTIYLMFMLGYSVSSLIFYSLSNLILK